MPAKLPPTPPPLPQAKGIQNAIDLTAGLWGELILPPDKILRDKAAYQYSVYAELLRDEQAASVFQQRRLAVTSCEWQVDPGDESPAAEEAAEAMREQLNQIHWDQVTDRMLYAIWYGFSVSELRWDYSRAARRVNLAEVVTHEQTLFKFDQERRPRLMTYNAPSDGLLLPDGTWWHFAIGGNSSANPYGLGLAHYLYWPIIFKRGGMRYWMVFLEKFGSPTALGKLPPGIATKSQERDRVLEALKAISTDTAVVVPDNVTVELLEATRSGTGDYEALQTRMDAAITKVILSQMLTTEATGGQYKADVQMMVRREVVKADADALCESWNRGPGLWFTRWNFGSDVAPPRVWRKTEPEEDLNARAERDAKVYQLGFEPTEEYIAETYGEGWVKREAQPPQSFQIPPAGQTEEGFGEADALALARRAHRDDQEALVRGAQALAANPTSPIAERVAELLGYLSETDDLATFRDRLTELVERGPKEQTTQAVERATWTARLMGLLRGQRTTTE